MERIRVIERGHTDLDTTTWKGVEHAPTLRHLADAGVLTISLPRSSGARLAAQCFVGKALLEDGTSLEIQEKIPGALRELLRHAARDVFRIEKIKAARTSLDELVVLLAEQFVDAVDAYVASGRLFRYSFEPTIAALAGGRIDISKTLGLRARGLGHLLAFHRTRLTRDVPENRVTLAALNELERLAQVVSLPDDLLSRSRGLAMLFDDCRSPAVLFGLRSALAEDAERLLEGEPPELIADVLALGAVVLSQVSFGGASTLPGSSPRAWFLNLELLFQTAVRRTLAALLTSGVVERGTQETTPVFPAATDRLNADPDLVLKPDSTSVVVGDVKYKDWTGRASAADLYQLLVHSAAYGSHRSFLVYPSDRYRSVRLGHSVTDTDVTLHSVDVRDLEAGLAQLLDEVVPGGSFSNPRLAV